MKKLMKSVFVFLVVCILLVVRQICKIWIKINKKVNWQALVMSLMIFCLLAYAVTIVVTELASGLQIEDIPRNSGWGMFHLLLVALSTLMARKVYKWLEYEK